MTDVGLGEPFEIDTGEAVVSGARAGNGPAIPSGRPTGLLVRRRGRSARGLAAVGRRDARQPVPGGHLFPEAEPGTTAHLLADFMVGAT